MRSSIAWIVWREIKDQRQNRMLWPVYLLLPLIGMAAPVLMAFSSAGLLSPKLAEVDPASAAMVHSIKLMAQAYGWELERAAATFMLRFAGGYFMLMPLAIVAVAGGYAIVGEKQQRSLEPVLATPISTHALLLGKFLAVLFPAVCATALASVLGATASMLSFHALNGILIWPDLFYWAATLVLAPLIGGLTALVCIGASARMQDPLAAIQVTALILIPALLLLLGVLGPAMLINLWFLGLAIAILLLLNLAAYAYVRRSFNREEILCRWR
jgi:ABC-2 type transport system permease protein